MHRDLPRALQAELEWAIALAHAKGSGCTAENAQQIHRAIRANSGMLAKRFTMFVDNAAPWHLEPDESSRLGHLLIALDAYCSGKHWRLWQPEDDGATTKKDDLLQVRLPAKFKHRLQLFCQRTGSNISRVVRGSIEANLADNPLWQSQYDEDDAIPTEEEE